MENKLLNKKHKKVLTTDRTCSCPTFQTQQSKQLSHLTDKCYGNQSNIVCTLRDLINLFSLVFNFLIEMWYPIQVYPIHLYRIPSTPILSGVKTCIRTGPRPPMRSQRPAAVTVGLVSESQSENATANESESHVGG